MKTVVHLNTIEIEQAVQQYVCKRYPNMCVKDDGVTIYCTQIESGKRQPLTAEVELVPVADIPDAFGR